MKLREEYLGKITWYLAELIPSAIFYKNKIGLFDINDYSEDFFKNLFNEIYDLKLINVNEIKANHPSIDLADKKYKICFQITSERNREKIEHTITQFLKYKLNKEYKELRVFILTRKKDYKLPFDTKKKFKLEIIDADNILLDIKNLEISKQKKILDFLESELDINSSIEQTNSGLEFEYLNELERIRSLIKSKKPISAKKLLANFKEQNWLKCSDIVKYKTLVNFGACSLQIEEFKEAGRYFIEALQYNPEDEKALSNASNGYLLLGNFEKAKDYAESAILKNPLAIVAHACLVHTSFDLQPGEIEKRVPKEIIEDSTISTAFSNYYYRRGELDKAIDWLELAVLRADEDKIGTEGHLGTLILEKLSKLNQNDLSSKIKPEHYPLLERAFTLIDNAVEQLSDSEVVSSKAELVFRRGICRNLKGNETDAIEDFKFAIKNDIKDFAPRRHLSAIYLKNREVGNAIDTMKIFEDVSLDLQSSVLYADLLRISENLSECLKICDLILGSVEEGSLFFSNILHVKAAAIAELGSFPDSLKNLENLIEKFPLDIGLLNIESRLLRTHGHIERAKEIVERSFKLLDTSTHYMDRCFLARECFDSKLYTHAIFILNEVVNNNPFHPDAKTLLFAYYNENQFDKALGWLKVLNENGRFDFQTTEIEILVYDQLGDLEKAEEACQRYLKHRDYSLNIVARLGNIYLRLNKLKELDELLSEEKQIDYKLEKLEAVVNFTNLLAIRGFGSRSIEILYKLRRVHFKTNSMPHRAYFSLFLQRERNLDENLIVKKVEKDSWLNIN